MKRQFFRVKILSMQNMGKKLLPIFICCFCLLAGCGHAASQSETDLYDDASYDAALPLTQQEETRSAQEVKRVGVAMPTKTSERWINDGMNIKAKFKSWHIYSLNNDPMGFWLLLLLLDGE